MKDSISCGTTVYEIDNLTVRIHEIDKDNPIVYERTFNTAREAYLQFCKITGFVPFGYNI